MVPNEGIAKGGPYTASGYAGEEFPFNFPILNTSHIAVWVNDTQIANGAGYSVTVTSSGGGIVGGHVTFDSSHLPASGAKVAIVRDVPVTQLTDLPDNGRFFPHVLEDMSDKAIMILQQHEEHLSRCAALPPTDTESGDAITVVRGYVSSAHADANSANNYMNNASVFAVSAYNEAQRASGYADNASAAALNCISAGGHTVSGAMTFNGGITVNNGLTAPTASISGAVLQNATVSGALTVINSGGLVISGEEAATVPFVLAQFGSSGYLKSAGGWTAYRQGDTEHTISSGSGDTIYWTTVHRDSSFITIGDPESELGGVTLAFSGGYWPNFSTYFTSSAQVHVISSAVMLDARKLTSSGTLSGGIVVKGGYISGTARGGESSYGEWEINSTNVKYDVTNSTGSGYENASYDIGGDGWLVNITGVTGKQIYASAYTKQNLINLRLNGFKIDITSSNGSGGIFLMESGVYSSARVLTDRDVIIPSGAMIEGQPFSTTVGGYTLTYTSNGGLTVSYHDYDEVAGVDTAQSAVFADGNITLVGSNDGNMEHYRIATGDGALVMEYGDDNPNSQTLIVGIGGITANGSAITQTTSEFDGTSLGIDTLEGGVKYVCASALSALSIGSAAPGCNVAIFFTVASGAVVTPPANVRRYGVTSYTPGSSYVMAVNGDMAVVAEEDTGV